MQESFLTTGDKRMKSIAALIVLAALLSGCAEIAESTRREEAERQESARQCAAQKWVIYRDQCMSPQDAREAQHRDFIADQAERDRQAMLQAACISRGGKWHREPFATTYECAGGSREVDINIRRY
jgi:hypothetical protein